MSAPEFAAALAKFQAELPHVKKGQTASVRSDKGNYSYDYADLTDITEVAMPVLAKHGLSFTARPTIADGAFILRYALKHEAGHEEGGDFPLPDPSRSTPQQIGSWLTYARRYSLCAVTGIAPGGDDDDAQRATDARAADLAAPKPAARRSRGQVDTTDPDAWTTDPDIATDVAWIEDIRTRLDLCGSVPEVRGLWAEMTTVYKEQRLNAADRVELEKAMTTRMAELKPAEATK